MLKMSRIFPVIGLVLRDMYCPGGWSGRHRNLLQHERPA
jgi:hypothetical protein